MAEPLVPTGFWSYTRDDDTHADNRLTQLRAMLAAELQAQIGGSPKVRVFQDFSMIPLGSTWEREINDALDQSSFLIPIVTPQFLHSEWCRKELLRFLARERALGRDDLIFPLRYIDTHHISAPWDGSADDAEALALLRSRQEIDFTALRFDDPKSKPVALKIEELATSIRLALRREVPRRRGARGATTSDSVLGGVETSTPRIPDPGVGDQKSPGKGRAWFAGIGVAAVLGAGTIGSVAWLVQRPAPPPVTGTPAPPPSLAPVVQAKRPPPPVYPAEAKDCDVCPVMVLVPPGRFTMGATRGEEEAEKVLDSLRGRSSPTRPVTIRQAFYMGKYPVTRGEFAAFIRDKGARPKGSGCLTFEQDKDKKWLWTSRADRSWDNPGFGVLPDQDRQPVVCISHDDAQDYVAWLREKTRGLDYVLPSETRWEYAARAVQSVDQPSLPRYWGAAPACEYGNVADAALARMIGGTAGDERRFFQCDDRFPSIAPVGRFKPNGFGLYDMLGNAWQWTGDCWNDTYQGSAPLDEAPWTTGDCSRRSLRGGSWGDYPRDVRAPLRGGNDTGDRLTITGFRVARTIFHP